MWSRNVWRSGIEVKVTALERCWCTESVIKRSSFTALRKCAANITPYELKALKHLAKELLSYSDKALTDAIEQGR